VQGVLTNDGGSPSPSDWRVLEGLADYIALGHVHKPFDFEDLLYNPGSLETCGLDEAAWETRGVLLVDVDSQNIPPHKVKRMVTPRRPVQRLQLKVDSCATATALEAACRTLIVREGLPQREGGLRPVVELSLVGSLAFSHQALNLEIIRTMLVEQLNPLHAMVRNLASPLVAGASEMSEEMSREQLEELVFSDVFGADSGYKAHGPLWAKGAMEVKRLALQETSPELIVSQVDATLGAVARAERGAR
jgi:DNA repair exonuclease SbcCD nuclease subunit